jgi:hypothetical protein
MTYDLFTSMPGLNRERGSLDKPYSTDNMVTGNRYFDGDLFETDLVSCSGTAYKYIADQYTPYGIGVWRYKPCFSVKSLHHNSGALEYPCVGCQNEGSSTPKGQTCSGPTGNNALWSLEESLFPDSVQLPVAERQRLNQRMNAKLPSIGKDVPDLAVFIAELGEIATLFDFIKRKWLEKITRRTQFASAAYITWSFGFAPMISDLQKIYENLWKWHERIQRVREGIGKVHDLTVGTVWTDTNTKSITGLDCLECNFPDCKGNYSSWETESNITEFNKANLTVKYRYSWPSGMDNIDNSVYGFLAANRFIPDIESVWEAIPFSFVVDWFVYTQPFFDALSSVGNHDVEVKIVDACLTLKKKRGVETGFFDKPSRSIRYRKSDEQLFYRWVGEEAFSKLCWSIKLPTFSQFLLGASLVDILRH